MHQKIDLRGALDRRSIFLGGATVVVVSTLVSAAAITSTSALAQSLSAQGLNDRVIERRAIEAVIWGMPAVNYDLMLQEMLRLGGKAN